MLSYWSFEEIYGSGVLKKAKVLEFGRNLRFWSFEEI